MDKKTKERLQELKRQRDSALTGFVDAMRLANSLSKEVRACMETLEDVREKEIRVAEDMLIS